MRLGVLIKHLLAAQESLGNGDGEQEVLIKVGDEWMVPTGRINFTGEHRNAVALELESLVQENCNED